MYIQLQLYFYQSHKTITELSHILCWLLLGGVSGLGKWKLGGKIMLTVEIMGHKIVESGN